MVKRVKIDGARILQARERYEMEAASGTWARAFNADPFARMRIMHHMRMGYENASEVAATAASILKAREGRVAYLGEHSNTDRAV